MIKQILQRWLGIQELSDSVAVLKHHEELRALFDLADIVDDGTDVAEYNSLLPGSYTMHGVTGLIPGDIIEPDPIKPEVIKGYGRSQ